MSLRLPGSFHIEGRRRFSPPHWGEEFVFPCFLVLCVPSVGWKIPTYLGESSLLYQAPGTQAQCSSGNSLQDAFRMNALPAIWVSLDQVKLTHEISITPGVGPSRASSEGLLYKDPWLTGMALSKHIDRSKAKSSNRTLTRTAPRPSW